MSISSIHKKWLLFLILSTWVLTGCTIREDTRSPIETLTLLNQEQNLGQTLVCHLDGLEQVTLYLSPNAPGQGSIEIHLRTAPEDTQDIRSASLPLQQITAPNYYTFQFAPVSGTTMRSYYLHIEMHGEGSVYVGTSAAYYQNGTLYRNGAPENAQLTFLLEYNPTQTGLGVAKEVLVWPLQLIISAFLYILPGWALFSLLWSNWASQHWAEKLALAAGLSLAIYPLFFLATEIINLHIGALYAWLPPLFGVVILLWRNRLTLYHLPATLRTRRASLSFSWSSHLWPDLLLILVLILVTISRFWVIRTLEGPLGSDPVHHTAIIQLFLNNNGMPDSWQPFGEMPIFTYHFGFHAAGAVYSWLTHMPAYPTVLWVGQILNILSVLAVYPLALRFNRNPWSGLAAVLLAGLLSVDPMGYLNVGRYTQMTAQIILPAAMVIIWEFLERERLDWKFLPLTWIILGGLALSHYRIAILGLLFVPALWVFGPNRHPFRVHVIRSIWIGLGSGLLFLPWLIHIFRGMLPTIAGRLLTTPSQKLLGERFEHESTLTFPRYVYWVGPVVLSKGLWQNNRRIALLSLWWLLVTLATRPDWLGLPGVGVLSAATVNLAIYIPCSIFVGILTAWVIEILLSLSQKRLWRYAAYAVILAAFVITGILGTQARISNLSKREMFMTRPDLKAIAWIQENTPQDARFLINSYFGFGTRWVLGTDAGWWLPLFAERQVNVPPMVYVTESIPYPEYRQQIYHLASLAYEKGLTDKETLSYMKKRGITHIYVGQRYGDLMYNGIRRPVSELPNDPHFRVLYHQDQVWILEVIY